MDGTVPAQGHSSRQCIPPARGGGRETRNRWQWLEGCLVLSHCSSFEHFPGSSSASWNVALLLTSVGHGSLLALSHPPSPMKQVLLPFCSKKTTAQRSSETCLMVTFTKHFETCECYSWLSNVRSYYFFLTLVFNNSSIHLNHFGIYYRYSVLLETQR